MKAKKTLIYLFIAFALSVMLAGCENSSSYSEGIDKNGFIKGVRALDYVELFDYQKMSIPSDVHQISDDDVQSVIDSLLTEYSGGGQITDRAVEKGNRVNIDYVGSIDGVVFESKDTDVIAGNMDFLDDFLVQIIGHMPGETFDVNITFPDPYPLNEVFAGKDALFVTTINYIVDPPELTDAFVAKYISQHYGWKTIDEMKMEIRSNLQKLSIEQYIIQYFSTDVVVRSVPEQLIAYQEQVLRQECQDTAASYGMELEEFLKSMSVSSLDELVESRVDSTLKSATFNLITQAVAEDAGFKVSNEDITDYLDDCSSDVDMYGLPYIKQNVLAQNVLDYIIDNAILE